MIDSKGVALVTVLAFLLILTIIAGTLLGLMTSYARMSEHQIRRIKAYYTVWAGLIHAMEDRRMGSSNTTWNITFYDEANTSFTANVNLTDITIGQLNSTVDYTR